MERPISHSERCDDACGGRGAGVQRGQRAAGRGRRDGRLHDVRAVQEEEDRAQREHLLAVVRPAAVHQREEGEAVRRLPDQRLQPRLDVPLALALQALVQAGAHVLQAEVLHRSVQLLERLLHRLLGVHRHHRAVQHCPHVILERLGQLRRHLQGLNRQFAHRCLRHGRAAGKRELGVLYL
jgi:hypothetical protein